MRQKNLNCIHTLSPSLPLFLIVNEEADRRWDRENGGQLMGLVRRHRKETITWYRLSERNIF